MANLESLKNRLARFNEERDWSQFHTPKNLSMALSVEASEIVELFQWMDAHESYNLDRDKQEKLEQEIGDVFLYLLTLSSKFDIDPVAAAERKLELNRDKYPVDKARGSAKKYDELDR